MQQQPWRTEDYFVSFYNYLDEIRNQFPDIPKRVKFHDITLHDGQQQANVIFQKQEKLKIARMLSDAGGDRIESGIIVGWWSKLEELNMPLEMFPFLPTFTGHANEVNIVLGRRVGEIRLYARSRN
ncbi:MAG: hypothetical protein ACYC7D_05895 [Nitrososphaerales archaeon]